MFVGVQEAHERADHCQLVDEGKTCLRTRPWFLRKIPKCQSVSVVERKQVALNKYGK
jgi:hypothetical protein